ncbi:MAG: sulfotransferase [Proteobacteria bacterium]|nr:sulfotransferase [Pseudomonadota bacterium]
MEKPLVYVAAVRRSGSNLLCEALSQLPHSFVFREPGWARGKFRLQPNVIELFRKCGLDLEALRKTAPAGDREKLLDFFVHDLLPALEPVVHQVGIKEIQHDGWRRLTARAPEWRVVLLGRDPRDIYLSLHDKRRDRGVALEALTPEAVSDEIRRAFAEQREIEAALPCLRVRYEDLCTDPGVLDAIRRFVECDLRGPGMVGELNRHNRRRHGDRITRRSVARWRTEPDPTLRREAHETFERLPEYAADWSYTAGDG